MQRLVQWFLSSRKGQLSCVLPQRRPDPGLGFSQWEFRSFLRTQLGTHMKTKLFLLLLFFHECEGRGESQALAGRGGTREKWRSWPPLPAQAVAQQGETWEGLGAVLLLPRFSETLGTILGIPLSCLSRVSLKTVATSQIEEQTYKYVCRYILETLTDTSDPTKWSIFLLSSQYPYFFFFLDCYFPPPH